MCVCVMVGKVHHMTESMKTVVFFSRITKLRFAQNKLNEHIVRVFVACAVSVNVCLIAWCMSYNALLQSVSVCVCVAQESAGRCVWDQETKEVN